MAGVQHGAQGCKGFKRTAQDRANKSTSSKRYKCSIPKLKCKASARARVNIGLAFERWRALKAAAGLKSDAEVAFCLLDVMKKLPSLSTSSGASDKKIKISQSEVQTMIEQEVRSAVKENETRLQGLIETVQNLDHGVDYEHTIQKLEARVNLVTKRAEVALAYMAKTQNKSPHPSPTNIDISRTEAGCETMETASQIDKNNMDCMDKNGELFQMMETTKKSLKKMRADNDALTAAIADLGEKLSPPALAPYGSSKHKDSLSYPPLPSTTFPSILNMEAASYNIPQRPEVHLALIRKPAGLSVLWKVEEDDPSAPPMDSYSIYMTTEKVKGSGTFPKWNMLGEVKAIKLPMCVMIKKYRPGHTVCVAVVGKDTFGRYGPYSKVVAAAIPD